MDILSKTYDRASCEIEDILQHQKFDKQDVELLGELIDVIKDVEMIYDYQDKMDGYSQMNDESYMRGRSGRMMPMYGRGSSYMRGRSMNMDSGYSGNDNKDMILNHLSDIADMAMDERDKKAIEKLMSQMSSQK